MFVLFRSYEDNDNEHDESSFRFDVLVLMSAQSVAHGVQFVVLFKFIPSDQGCGA